jgi:putative ABC transport system substrate-binding protein
VRFATLSLALTLAAAAQAQQSTEIYRVGLLNAGGQAANRPMVDALREGMRALGYVEARNLVLDERYAEGSFDRLPALARDLLQREPRVLVAATTPGALAAKAAARGTPIVFVAVADPVGAGLVPRLARPGGNITGITNIVAELAGKRLELLKQIVPAARSIAVLMNPDDPNAPLQMRHARAAARRLGIELQPVLAIRGPADLAKAFEAAEKAHAAAALRFADPVATMLRKDTAALAIQHRLPVIYAFRQDAEAGGLMAYGTNLVEQYRQAARLVDKILRGAKAGDLSVEQPTRFDLVINRRAAEALRLIIPPQLLVEAEIVE